MIETRAAKLLYDAAVATEKIGRFTAGKDEAEFNSSDLLQSAVERQFEIIGEAIGALRRQSPRVADRIPDLVKIIGFRNVLIHEYDQIRAGVIWRTVKVELRRLRAVLQQLLAEAEPP